MYRVLFLVVIVGYAASQLFLSAHGAMISRNVILP